MTTHRAQLERGKVVVGGEIRWLSATAIQTGDHSHLGGCGRRWHYKYVAGKPEPGTAAQSVGQTIHSEIENYLLKGARLTDPRILVGAQYIPVPGPGLMVEASIGDGTLAAAGIPIAGHADLVNERGEFIRSTGELVPESGMVEVVDWKSTSDMRWAKSGSELVATVQMPLYGEWAARKTGAEWVRLSHVYFRTKGAPEARKVTIRLSRNEIGRRWEETESTVRSLVQVARVKPEHSGEVEAGPASACNAYGGCPHRAYCAGPEQKTLYDLLGKGTSMSLLAKLDGIKPPKADVDSEIARLKAAEAKPDPLKDAIAAIRKSGKGFPTLVGEAAKAYAKAEGVEITSGAGLAGSGLLGGIELESVEQFAQLVTELKTQELPALLPPDAPESKPELAAKPVEPAAPAKAPDKIPAKAPETLVMAPISEPTNPTPKKRGRAAKSETPIASETPRSAVTVSEPVVVSTDTDDVRIYVDCIPGAAAGPYEPLDPYVDRLCAFIATEYGTPDVRCAPKGTPLEFGQWKGVVAALARSKPPGAGTYFISTRSELAAIVADALKEFVAAWGVK